MAIPKTIYPKGATVKYNGELWTIIQVFSRPHPKLTWYDLESVETVGQSNLRRTELSIEHNELEIE
jgi:hypothetical protein